MQHANVDGLDSHQLDGCEASSDFLVPRMDASGTFRFPFNPKLSEYVPRKHCLQGMLCLGARSLRTLDKKRLPHGSDAARQDERLTVQQR